MVEVHTAAEILTEEALMAVAHTIEARIAVGAMAVATAEHMTRGRMGQDHMAVDKIVAMVDVVVIQEVEGTNHDLLCINHHSESYYRNYSNMLEENTNYLKILYYNKMVARKRSKYCQKFIWVL
jgi:hypothetical protein